MLERHFRSLMVIDRIRAQWLGPQIERYAQSLDELHTGYRHCSAAYSGPRALQRVRRWSWRSKRLDELPDHVDAFVSHWLAEHVQEPGSSDNRFSKPFACGADALPGPARFHTPELPSRQCHSLPACPASSHSFSTRKDCAQPRCTITALHFARSRLIWRRQAFPCRELTPSSITDFITTRAQTLHKSGMLNTVGALRVFLAYLHREGIIANDLARSVPRAASIGRHLFHALFLGLMSNACWPASTAAPTWASATTPF
jgi:integrase/recombinase XerD